MTAEHRVATQPMKLLPGLHFTCHLPQKVRWSPDSQRMLSLPNAGGSSLISEALAFELLARAFGASLSKTELELDYSAGSKMTDFAIDVFGGYPLGVSVTRAYKWHGVGTWGKLSVASSIAAPRFEPAGLEPAEARRLLTKKLIASKCSPLLQGPHGPPLHVTPTSHTGYQWWVRVAPCVACSRGWRPSYRSQRVEPQRAQSPMVQAAPRRVHVLSQRCSAPAGRVREAACGAPCKYRVDRDEDEWRPMDLVGVQHTAHKMMQVWGAASDVPQNCKMSATWVLLPQDDRGRGVDVHCLSVCNIWPPPRGVVGLCFALLSLPGSQQAATLQPGRYAGCPVYTNARGIIDGYYMVIQHDVRMIRIRFGSRVLQCTVLSSSAAISSTVRSFSWQLRPRAMRRWTYITF